MMSTIDVTMPMHNTHTMINLYIGLMFFICEYKHEPLEIPVQ